MGTLRIGSRVALVALLGMLCAAVGRAAPDEDSDDPNVWRNRRAVARADNSPITSIVLWPDSSKFAVSSGAFTRHIEVFSYPEFKKLQDYKLEANASPRIDQLALSPDTKTLAAAAGNVVMLFDTATGTIRQELKGHTDRITTVAYTKDGQRLVSGSADKTIRVWTAAGASERVIDGPKATVYQLAISPDDKLIASAGDHKPVFLWNLQTGAQVAAMEGHEYGPRRLAFSPNGKQLVTAGMAPDLFLWDVPAKKLVRKLEGVGKDVEALAFNKAGTTLLTGGKDAAVRIWDLKKGTSGPLLRSHLAWLDVLVLLPDEKNFLTADSHGAICSWSMEEALKQPEKFQLLGDELDSFTAHEDNVTSIALAPNGKTLFIHSTGDWVGIWDLAAKKLKHKIPHKTISALPCAVSSDGKYAAYGEEYSNLRVIDLATAKQVFHSERLDGFVTEVLFTPDKKRVLVSAGKKVYAFDLPTGKEAYSWEAEATQIEAMALLPGGKELVTGGEEKKLKIWNLTTRKLVKTLPAHQDKVLSICPTRDGKKLISMDIFQKLRVWDIAAEKQVQEFDPDTARVDVMQLLPGDRILAFGHRNDVAFWDMETGLILKRRGHLDEVWGLVLLPDGKTLMSGAGDGTVKTWAIPTPESMREQATDPKQEEEIRKRLRDRDKIEIPFLVGLLAHKNADYRREASDIIIGWQKDTATTGGLVLPLLKHENPQVRIAAARVIGSLDANSKIGIPELLALLKDPSADVREAGAKGLAHIGKNAASETAPALLAALADAEPKVRAAAAQALPTFGSKYPKIVPSLVALAKDPDGTVREMAVDALGDIDPAPNDTIPTLIAALSDEVSRVRWKAAFALRRFGAESKDAIPGLVKMLEQGDRDEQTSAANTLGAMGDAAKPAIGALIQFSDRAKDLEFFDGMAALQRLGPEGEDYVLKQLKHQHPDRRRGAAILLMGTEGRPLNPRYLSPMVDALSDTNADVRRFAAFAVKNYQAQNKMGDLTPKAVDGLLSALKQAPELQGGFFAEALASFGSAAKKTVPELRKLHEQSKNPDEKRAVAAAIVAIEGAK